MQRDEPLLMLLASGGDETVAALLQSELDLARMLLRKRLATADQIAQAVRLRQASGLVLEHCLVKIGAVPFDIMIEVMDARRAKARRRPRRPGDGGYGAGQGPLAG